MDNKIVIGIHQPNFAPWIGYFYKIYHSDIFIFLDDVQIQKTGASYCNRVSICVNGKSQYLTIPIKRERSKMAINGTIFLNDKWRIKTIKTLQANYAKAPFFKENFKFFSELIMFKTNCLSEFNTHFIMSLCRRLNINTTFKFSSDFKLIETSTDRLIKLIKLVDGNVYLSGGGGDNYQELSKFKSENIHLIYNVLPSIEYPQLKTENFINGLSIIDVLFNLGLEETSKIIKIKI